MPGLKREDVNTPDRVVDLRGTDLPGTDLTTAVPLADEPTVATSIPPEDPTG